MNRATGEIVGWLNSDDTLLPGALRYVGGYFALHRETDWLIGHARNIDADDRPLTTRPTQDPTGRFTLAGALLRDETFNVPQPAAFWRRRLHQRVGYLDEALHHCMDFDLWCRFLAKRVRAVTVRKELATYRFHEASKTCGQPERFERALIGIEQKYAPLLGWRDRLRLTRLIGYQQRSLAVRGGDRLSLARRAAARPWWLASRQVWSGLLRKRRAA